MRGGISTILASCGRSSFWRHEVREVNFCGIFLRSEIIFLGGSRCNLFFVERRQLERRKNSSAFNIRTSSCAKRGNTHAM